MEEGNHLQRFLRHCKEGAHKLQQEHYHLSIDRITVVLGNESCDLDSMVSSVLLAAIDSTTEAATAHQSPRHLHLPVLDCRRADFHLRPEATTAFGLAGVTVDDLIFVPEDVDLSAVYEKYGAQMELQLVDHNQLASKWAALADAVTQIYDHHTDAEKHVNAARVICRTGSGVSVVVNAALQEPRMVDRLQSFPHLCLLVQQPILLDTYYFDPHRDKATDVDRAAFFFCQQAWYSHLSQLRSDVTQLSLAQLLRRDTKMAVSESAGDGISIAVVSTPVLLHSLLARDADWPQTMARFAEERRADAVVVLASSLDHPTATASKQLLIMQTPRTSCAAGSKLMHQLSDALSVDQQLRLEPIASAALSATPSADTVAFSSTDVHKISRKRVLPVLQALIRSMKRDDDHAGRAT